MGQITTELFYTLSIMINCYLLSDANNNPAVYLENVLHIRQ